MGTKRRALNRSQQKKQTVSNPNFARKQDVPKREEQPDLTQVELTHFRDHDEQASKVPFVLPNLPLSEESLRAMIRKYSDSDVAITANVVIGRLRDYHNPLAGDHKQEDWNKFVIALVDLWNSDAECSKVVASHLKEIIGEGGRCGEVVVKFTQKKLLKIVRILKQIKLGGELGAASKDDGTLKVLQCFAQC